MFCHDHQNRNAECERGSTCRFIHCTRQEEEEYRRSGYLPPHIRDQVKFVCIFVYYSKLVGCNFISYMFISNIIIICVVFQAINKGISCDLPALFGARPICKDHLKKQCKRKTNCRFRYAFYVWIRYLA